MATTIRRPLLLNGFMGTGKSTIGPLVAHTANVPFIDLDAAIEKSTGQSIASIFESEGEPAFRAIEANTLSSLLASPEPRVIALGGGTLVDPQLRDQVHDMSVVVTLVARPDTINVRTQNHFRPLLDSAGHRITRIHELLAARATAYADTHAQIRTDDRSPHDVAEAVYQAWLDRSIPVRTRTASYSARITTNAAQALAELARVIAPSSTFLVTDQNVEPLTGNAVSALQSAKIPLGKTIVLTPGEIHKQWSAVEQILDSLIHAGADRSSLIIAIGGGVVSDIAGFAAAILFRGIRWIAVPTTLLSMVDAAVGGKTGVDLRLAKNVIGAFHHPAGVIVDPTFVQSESSRAFTSGLAEVVKSGAIADPSLIEFIEHRHAQIQGRHIEALREVIQRSLQVKALIVSRDEHESAERMLLNFGHTIGHALEAAGRFSRLTHGEAVALGMVAILRFGVARGITSVDDASRIETLLKNLGLPTDLSQQPLDEALQLIAFDKKRTASNLRLVLLENLGRMRIESIPIAEVRSFFEQRTGKIAD